jgi:hypothetical protein
MTKIQTRKTTEKKDKKIASLSDENKKIIIIICFVFLRVNRNIELRKRWKIGDPEGPSEWNSDDPKGEILLCNVRSIPFR